MQTPGFAGSWMSHQAVIRATPADQSVLVFEDDAVPGEDFEARCTALLEQLARHDPDWQGLWLGYDNGYRDLTPIDRNLCRHRDPLNTHAYALRGALLEMATELRPEDARISHWDGALRKLCGEFPVYAPHHGGLVGQACWLGIPDPKDNYRDLR